MFTKFHKSILAATVAAAAALAGAIPAIAQSNEYTLRMENNTGFDIYQMRLSSVNQTYWPPDLLGDSRVFSDGTSFTITNISPGRYDMAFIDEDADVCVLHNVPIRGNLDWDLSRGWLLDCEQ
jgi:hypothetical protein